MCACSSVNSMDSSNLAIIFAPTIFRPDMIDPMKAVMEMKLSKFILKEMIDRLSLLQQAMHLYSDAHRPSVDVSSGGGGGGGSGSGEMFIFENPIKAYHTSALDDDLAGKLNISEVRHITDNIGSRLASRMVSPKAGAGGGNRGGGGSGTGSGSNSTDGIATKLGGVDEGNVTTHSAGNRGMLPPTPVERQASYDARPPAVSGDGEDSGGTGDNGNTSSTDLA